MRSSPAYRPRTGAAAAVIVLGVAAALALMPRAHAQRAPCDSPAASQAFSSRDMNSVRRYVSASAQRMQQAGESGFSFRANRTQTGDFSALSITDYTDTAVQSGAEGAQWSARERMRRQAGSGGAPGASQAGGGPCLLPETGCPADDAACRALPLCR